MFSRKSRRKAVVTEEYVELRETICNLQTVAASLQDTAVELRERVDQLRLIQEATPNFLRRRAEIG